MKKQSKSIGKLLSNFKVEVVNKHSGQSFIDSGYVLAWR